MVLIKSLSITFIVMVWFLPITVNGIWHCPLSLVAQFFRRKINQRFGYNG